MRLRVARPTLRLPDILRFYEDALRLRRIAAFRDHDGYDGVIFGAPDERAQLEFTTRAGARAPPPTEDAHLVLYYDDLEEQRAAVARLAAAGFVSAEPHNPWWQRCADAFVDPDGWEVVLVRPDA